MVGNEIVIVEQMAISETIDPYIFSKTISYVRFSKIFLFVGWGLILRMKCKTLIYVTGDSLIDIGVI